MRTWARRQLHRIRFNMWLMGANDVDAFGQRALVLSRMQRRLCFVGWEAAASIEGLGFLTSTTQRREQMSKTTTTTTTTNPQPGYVPVPAHITPNDTPSQPAVAPVQPVTTERTVTVEEQE